MPKLLGTIELSVEQRAMLQEDLHPEKVRRDRGGVRGPGTPPHTRMAGARTPLRRQDRPSFSSNMGLFVADCAYYARLNRPEAA